MHFSISQPMSPDVVSPAWADPSSFRHRLHNDNQPQGSSFDFSRDFRDLGTGNTSHYRNISPATEPLLGISGNYVTIVT
jgi:hypothetical protein